MSKKSDPTSVVELVTPTLAQHYLGLNHPNNRAISKPQVERYAHEMRTGRFLTTGQGLQFDTNGFLIDGQHRLKAIVLAGVGVRLMVTRGVHPDAYKTIDAGRMKSIGTRMALNDNVAKALNFIGRLLYANTPLISHLEQIHKSLETEIELAVQVRGNAATPYFASAPVLAAVAVQLARGMDADYVLDNYKNLLIDNYDDLPEICRAWHKQARKTYRVNSTSRNDVYGRALKAFDPAYSSHRSCRPYDASEARDMTAAVIK